VCAIDSKLAKLSDIVKGQNDRKTKLLRKLEKLLGVCKIMFFYVHKNQMKVYNVCETFVKQAICEQFGK